MYEYVKNSTQNTSTQKRQDIAPGIDIFISYFSNNKYSNNK